MEAAREKFLSLIRGKEEQIPLAEAALWIAAEHQAGLDVGLYLGKLKSLGDEAKASLESGLTGMDAVRGLNRFLYREKGFSGNQREYLDVRNSFLNEVMERRTGIPITLAILYMDIAQRLGLRAEGISFPSHFLVKILEKSEIILDPFSGDVLGPAQCEALLARAYGNNAKLQPQFLKSAGKREILARVLRNLKQIFLGKGELAAALACSDRLLSLNPEDPFELRDRGMVYQQLECFSAALKDLEKFLEMKPHDVSAETIREQVMKLRGEVNRMQ